MKQKRKDRGHPIRVTWKTLEASALTLSLLGSVGLGTAATAQAARVTDDESRYNLVTKFDLGYNIPVAIGSMKAYPGAASKSAFCFDLGAGVGPLEVPGTKFQDGNSATAAWLFAYADKNQNMAAHVTVGFAIHKLYDPKGWEAILAGPDPRLPGEIAKAEALIEQARQNAGPYSQIPVDVKADNLGPLVDTKGTATVTVGAPKSAAGVDQNVDIAVKLENGGIFDSTGAATATVKPGATLKASGVPAGQVNVSATTVADLPGTETIAFYAPDGPERQQNLMAAAAGAKISGAGRDFLKYGQRLDSQVIYQGGYSLRDTIQRSGFISGTTADVTADVYITGEKFSEEGTPTKPADAVLATSLVVKGVDKDATTPGFDAAAVEKAAKAYEAANPGKTARAYVVLSTPETSENRAFTSNHLIASEGVEFTKPTTTVVTETKETVKETVKTVEVPVINAGYAVPVQAASVSAAGPAIDGSLLVGGAAALLALLVGAGVYRARQAR